MKMNMTLYKMNEQKHNFVYWMTSSNQTRLFLCELQIWHTDDVNMAPVKKKKKRIQHINDCYGP